MLDKPVPDFDLAAVPGLDQPGLATADLAGGGVVMVNFFASWCVPCRAEHPFLSALTEETGVPLYGITHRDKPEDAAAWLAELGNPYRRIGADRSEEHTSELPSLMRISYAVFCLTKKHITIHQL